LKFYSIIKKKCNICIVNIVEINFKLKKIIKMELNDSLDMGMTQKNDGVNISASLNNEMRGYLDLAAYWARFLGIVGYVLSSLIGIAVLMMIFGLGFFSTMAEENPLMPQMGGVLAIAGLFYLGLVAIFFYTARAMHQFGTKTRQALVENDDTALELAFKNLKSFFRTNGIFTAVVLGFYGIVLIIGLLIGGTALLSR
jgi:hypothetical protein